MKKYYLMLLTALVLSAIPVSLNAQTDEYSLRTSANIGIKLAKGLALEIAPEYRFNPATNASEYLMEAGLSYRIISWLSVGGYYRLDGSKVTDMEGTGGSSFETSNRFSFDASTKVSIKRFTPKFRVRFCNFTDFDKSTDDKTNYMRYRIGLDYNIKDFKLTPFVSAEFYQKLSTGLFSQSRYTIGGEYELNKKNAIVLSYSLSDKYKTLDSYHIFELSYKIKF